MWDLFISHASEDKETLVRPLAQTLMRRGVAVWYDEFSMKAGDSLIACIEDGLHESNYGLIVISPDFLKKNWTEYELRSLITKQVESGNQKKIIPVWHNVTKADVQAKSYYIADLLALSSVDGVETLAERILEIVRPEIVSLNGIKRAFEKSLHEAKVVEVDLSEMKQPQRRHDSLPKYMIPGSMLLSSVFPSMPANEMLDSFMRDLFYDGEYIIWNIMACSYIETMRHFNFSLSDEGLYQKMLSALIMLSLGDTDGLKTLDLDEKVKIFLANTYINQSKSLKVLKKIPYGDTDVMIKHGE
ncbi:MAG: toll/interleukin-1 receptor domain-containing protein [Clostridia bacterium]|nr:toll/interleukin-1 receptor domain-containing protein [Clostridia bacterium]